MGGTCSTHGKSWKMHTIFCLERLKGRDNSEDLGVDGRIISELILGKGGVDWMHLA